MKIPLLKNMKLLTFLQVYRLMNREQNFENLKGSETNAKLPLSWKEDFDAGIVIPKKARYCAECKKHSICGECDRKKTR